MTKIIGFKTKPALMKHAIYSQSLINIFHSTEATLTLYRSKEASECVRLTFSSSCSFTAEEKVLIDCLTTFESTDSLKSSPADSTSTVKHLSQRARSLEQPLLRNFSLFFPFFSNLPVYFQCTCKIVSRLCSPDNYGSLFFSANCWCTCNGQCSQRMCPKPALNPAFAEFLALLSADDHSRSFLKNFLQLEQTSLSIWF